MTRSTRVGESDSKNDIPTLEAQEKLLPVKSNKKLYIMGNLSKEEGRPPEEIQSIDNALKMIQSSNGSMEAYMSAEGVKEEKIEVELAEREARCRKCAHWTKVVWSLISFLISVADVTVILYLSYLHFSHSSDIIAWLMLMPILLNFIGIFTFLSDDDERREMEALGCQNLFWRNLMFFPVLGPSVCSLKLFLLSMREHEAERFERLESLTIRMKQYESFFRAAPEAFVQLTFRIITWTRTRVFDSEDYWTNVCLTLCVFALAESNMYSSVIPYYRLFHREKTKHAWSIEHIRMRWRVALFFYNFWSIASRLYADAIFKATCCFYFHEYSFGEVLIVAFLIQFMMRAGLHSFFVGFLGSKRQRDVLRETGVYGAFTYSWRCLFMSFDYNANCLLAFISFYLENFILIGGSYFVISTFTDVDLSDKYIFHIYAISSVAGIIFAIGMRLSLRKRYRRSTSAKVHAEEKY